MTSYEPGVPSWVDLGTPDLDAARAFYGKLFGWSSAGLGPEAGGYDMFKRGEAHVAGVGPLQGEGVPSAWTSYIATDDVDGAVKRVEEAGGAVFVPPMDVMEAGRMAIAADPTGAVFGIWQPREFIGAELVNEAGTLCWNELMTRDVDAAKSFYAAVFGWGAHSSSADDSAAGMDYTEFQIGERSIAGMMAMPDGMPAEVPSNWLVYFAVDDCDASVAAADSAGGSVATPPMDIPSVGRFAVLNDPFGAVFAVITMNMAAAG